MNISARVKDTGGRSNSLRADAVRLLSLYTDAPQEELTIDEFEMFAWHRLQLLYNIERLRTSGFEGDQFNNKLKNVESIHMPLNKQEVSLSFKSRGYIISMEY